ASSLIFLSPASAVLLGWFVLNERLSPLQLVGFVVVIFSVWLSQRFQPALRPAIAAARAGPR
ncbi:MAG TPA: EamA family transporter, partial [Pseudorhodoplanes sp.]|nr:EamA family transporter [Pseudorhodoplanes sp.]